MNRTKLPLGRCCGVRGSSLLLPRLMRSDQPSLCERSLLSPRSDRLLLLPRLWLLSRSSDRQRQGKVTLNNPDRSNVCFDYQVIYDCVFKYLIPFTINKCKKRLLPANVWNFYMINDAGLQPKVTTTWLCNL